MDGAQLPAFICVGAAKCGTTSLYHYLKQHPDIFLPDQKELHFHSAAELMERPNGPGMRAVLADVCQTGERYQRHYAGARARQVAGDISPSYFNHPGAAASIAATLDDPRIVIMLRNPVQKVHSQFMHLRRAAREPLSFEEALAAEEQRAHAGWGDMWLYRRSGFYADHVERFLERFGRDRVLVILTEEFQRDTRAHVDQVLRFIGVRGDVPIDVAAEYNRSGAPRSAMAARLLRQPVVNRLGRALLPHGIGAWAKRTLQSANTGAKEPLAPATAASLAQDYRADIARLEALIGRSTGWTASAVDKPAGIGH